MENKSFKFNEIKYDLYRCNGSTDLITFFKMLMLNSGFKYIFWMRICTICDQIKILRYSILTPMKIIHRHYMYKYGIIIPYKTSIGKGFKINHFSGIVINPDSILGNNITICQNVTIGKLERGKNKGCPKIGNNVYIGAGAKVLGGIEIEDDVLIGANAVITENIKKGSVVSAQKGFIISENGSHGYIKNNIEEIS